MNFIISSTLQESAANGEPVALEVFILSHFFISLCFFSLWECWNKKTRQMPNLNNGKKKESHAEAELRRDLKKVRLWIWNKIIWGQPPKNALGKTSRGKKCFLSSPYPNILAPQEMHFWSLKGVYFFQNANNLNFILFFLQVVDI